MDVSGIDNESPYLVSNETVGDFLHLKVADDGLGIDYDKIYAETLSGTVIKPYSIKKSTGEIIFEIPDESMNIYIPDVKENTLQLVITIT